ncbi:MAG: TetR/AcrR family transcriptional regulator [Myxococcales bacterium]|nr:TetR/AcrR family transcriptional regulator [Myxococcales bacterium]
MGASERREREREERRTLILEAARGVVLERGFAALTMDAVAKRAELSKGTLYLYFDSRDALCAALGECNMQRLLPQLRAAIGEASSGLVAIRALHHFQVSAFEAQPHMFRFIVGWLLSGEPLETSSPSFGAYREKVGEIISLLMHTIERGKLDGSIRRDVDTLLQAKHLWASFLGVFMLHLDRENDALRSPFPVDTRALLALHEETILRALSPEGRPLSPEGRPLSPEGEPLDREDALEPGERDEVTP